MSRNAKTLSVGIRVQLTGYMCVVDRITVELLVAHNLLEPVTYVSTITSLDAQ
jgi:hypothetical protein